MLVSEPDRIQGLIKSIEGFHDRDISIRFAQMHRGTRRGLSVLAQVVQIAIAIVVTWTAPTIAAVKPSDAAATHAYLKAKLAQQRAIAKQLNAGLAAIEAVATKVNAECPGVLAGAPLDMKPESKSAGEISDEIGRGALGAPERQTHPLIARFDRAVRHLRWSNPRLTRLVHEDALEQDEQSALAPPDLCADARAWVASGYTTTSPATKRLLHELDRISSITLIESEPHEKFTFNVDSIIARRLKPYENRADRLLARKLRKSVEPLELLKPNSPQAREVLALFEAAGKVYADLGTSP
jgi:hypothetical protein